MYQSLQPFLLPEAGTTPCQVRMHSQAKINYCCQAASGIGRICPEPDSAHIASSSGQPCVVPSTGMSQHEQKSNRCWRETRIPSRQNPSVFYCAIPSRLLSSYVCDHHGDGHVCHRENGVHATSCRRLFAVIMFVKRKPRQVAGILYRPALSKSKQGV